MTIRTDISVDWETSPRIITVGSPSVEITMQDLLDTMRDTEAKVANMDDLSIIDAAGKENLGGGIKVGLTVTLLNAKLAFEARTGPTWTQCRISGGNLVAVDGAGSDISAVEPTAYTQVILANSSSATLQEQGAIQYSSFEGGVTVDTGSSNTGTEYPVGTAQAPVNNMADALDIAIARGLTSFYILGDLTLDDALDFEQYSFYGESADKTTLTIEASALVQKCEFYEATIKGTLDGQSKIKNCVIQNVNYISGYVELCVLDGTVILGGGADAYFLDCWAGTKKATPPVVDMGGAGQTLVLQNFNGSIKISNKTGANDEANIALNAGMVVLDATVTSGDINVMGTGAVFDNSNGAVVDTTYLVSPDSVATAVWAYER